jgi:hypothetical protein
MPTTTSTTTTTTGAETTTQTVTTAVSEEGVPPKYDPSSSKLLLRYWNCQGRGMLARYMAYDAGIDFTDDIVDGPSVFLGAPPEDWGTKKFHPDFAGAFKALPLVQHNGGSINETGACCQYIAEVCGYTPSDPMDRARVVMICDHVYEDLLINVA